jgi:hypothetical protein
MAASNRHTVSTPTNHGSQIIGMNAPVPCYPTLIISKQWLCDLLQQDHLDSFNDQTFIDLIVRSIDLYRSMQKE